MAPERAARGRAGGGASISPKRPTRIRLITGALALAIAAAVAALSLDTRSGGLVFVSGALGLVAILLLGSLLVLAQPGWIGAALGLLALLYFGHMLVAGESRPLEVALVSVALLLVGELAQWSLDARLRGRYDAAMHRSRAVGIAMLGLLGLGAVALAEVAAGLPIPGGLATVALATVAAVALLGLISFVAVRRAGGVGR